MRLPVLAAALLVGFSTTGCGTLLTGSHDDIVFESEPSGAEIVIDGFVVGQTPTTVPVKRAGFGSRQVTLRLDGYEPTNFVLSKGLNLVSVLNLVNILGWGVDAVTGSVMQYDRRMYDIKLDLSPDAPPPPTDTPLAREVEPVVEPVEEPVRVEIPPAGRQRVRWVQERLNARGYECGVVDGRVGRNTRGCVRAFQTDAGLQATGEIDDDLLETLAIAQ